jgi:DNA-binding NarL/FixJ family response regulator
MIDKDFDGKACDGKQPFRPAFPNPYYYGPRLRGWDVSSAAVRRPIRVVIADDHAVVREGVRQVLANAHEFDVAGEAASADEAVARAAELHPDVIVLDLRMPGGAGVETIRRVRAASPTSRVVIFSMHDDDEYVVESMRAGASGYVSKEAPPSELRDAVRAVERGEIHTPRPRARKQAVPRPDAPAPGDRLAALTPREVDVLKNVAAGRTNKEIAARLSIGTRTVESHRESLMQKLGVRHVAGLIRVAIEEGLVED